MVTITDKTDVLPTETLTYREYTRANGSGMSINGSDIKRKTIRWIIDFKQIKRIRTSFRLDGNYYTYKSIDNIYKASTISNQSMADGNPYKYIGIYVGGNTSANGSQTRSADMNLTAITRIPAIRLILSARIETSLYRYARNLSEVNGVQRGFVLDNVNDYLPSATQTNIYGRDRFVGLYPDYYISLDDLNTPIPFYEKFIWAKDNDPALYNELAKLVVKSNTNYYFNPNRTSLYYSANINITKEIRDFASITFNAINFLNNMSRVHSSWSNSNFTLYESSYIPNFYYGLSLRLKL